MPCDAITASSTCVIALLVPTCASEATTSSTSGSTSASTSTTTTPGQCSDPGDDCSETKCCNEADAKCFTSKLFELAAEDGFRVFLQFFTDVLHMLLHVNPFKSRLTCLHFSIYRIYSIQNTSIQVFIMLLNFRLACLKIFWQSSSMQFLRT